MWEGTTPRPADSMDKGGHGGQKKPLKFLFIPTVIYKVVNFTL